MHINSSTNDPMTTFDRSQELLDSLRIAWEEQQNLEWEQEEEILLDELRYREYASEEEKKQNAVLLYNEPPILRRERPEDYTLARSITFTRQDTIEPSPILRRERPEDYAFSPNSLISNIRMSRTPVAHISRRILN